MAETDNLIRAECPLYVCRVCRTKTGWPHQCWCCQAQVTNPDCEECRYYDRNKTECVHPARGKGDAA